MAPTITTVLDQEILPATPISTSWFSNCQFLVFQSNSTGEYIATGEFVEVAVALFVQIPNSITSIERGVREWQDTIDNINLIVLPDFLHDCLKVRLQINPSTGFHARILAISC